MLRQLLFGGHRSHEAAAAAATAAAGGVLGAAYGHAVAIVTVDVGELACAQCWTFGRLCARHRTADTLGAMTGAGCALALERAPPRLAARLVAGGGIAASAYLVPRARSP